MTFSCSINPNIVKHIEWTASTYGLYKYKELELLTHSSSYFIQMSDSFT